MKTGATLELAAGTFRFSELWLEPDSTIHLEGDGQTVLYVDGKTTFRGSIDAPNGGTLLIVALGQQEFLVNAPFRGSVLAPYGTIKLTSAGSKTHKGTFIAKRIDVDSAAIIVHEPLSFDFVSNARTTCALAPKVICVDDDGTNLSAHFSYDNEVRFQGTAVPIGTFNRFSPGDESQGQPDYFLEGFTTTTNAPRFSVTFPREESRTWTLGGRQATASLSSPACQ